MAWPQENRLVVRAQENRAEVLADHPGAIAALDQLEQAIRDDLSEAGIPVTPSTAVAMIAGAEAVAARLIEQGLWEAIDPVDEVIITLLGLMDHAQPSPSCQ